MRFVAAAIQYAATSDEARNRALVERWVGAAVDQGASFVATPENATYLGPHAEKVARAEALDGPTVGWAAELARRHSIHFLLGSFAERSPDPNRCYNTSVLLDPAGEVVASYRKVHLFDVDYPPELVFYESATVVAGQELVVVDIGCARVGMSICYDLRFPDLYLALVDRGADLIVIPSAFTAVTGRAHWEILIRARAIETQCYVVAPGQCGRHDDEGLRESWGHSMIVGPWGEVLAVVAGGEGVAIATIDREAARAVRARLPVRAHRHGRSLGTSQIVDLASEAG